MIILDNMELSEQIRTFQSLFQGRTDAYGLETEQGPIAVKKPFTPEVVQDHLEGKRRIGFYPLRMDDTVLWSSYDFDSASEDEIKLVIAKMVDFQLFPYLEKSKSKGFHLHLFFGSPVESRMIRALMSEILKQTDVKAEIFPKQDRHSSSNGNLGNFLFLPLFGESVEQGRTVFFNYNFQVYENQWEYLSKIYRTPSQNVLDAVKRLNLDRPEKTYREQPNFDVSKPPRGVKVCYWIILNQGVEKGGRHQSALRISKYLQTDQGLAPDIAKATLIQWNERNRPPLSEKELNVERTISDGIKYDYGCRDEVLKAICSPQCHLYRKDQGIDELCSEDVIEFIDRKIENPQALIEGGILPQRGQLFIGGSSKRGKSILGGNLALNLVTATPFLGQFTIPKKRRGSIFQAEISEVSMQDRLQKMIRNMTIKPEPGYLEVINKKGLNLNRPKDFDLIRKKIETHQSEFVMIDPMYRFHSGDENKSSEMKTFFSQTDQLTEKCGVVVILIHHFGKPTEFEREGAQMLRGSSTIFDYGDSYLSLKRQSRNKPKEYITVSFELRNAEDPDSLYLWRNPETLWYEVQAIDSTSIVTDHDVLSLIESVNGEVMRSDLIKMIVDTFRVSQITASRTIEHAKHLLIEERVKAKGKPIKIKLKP